MQEFTHKSNYSLQRIRKEVTSDLGGKWERFQWILSRQRRPEEDIKIEKRERKH